MNHFELLMRRRVVQAFIDADPVRIEFSRSGPTEKTAAGGYVQGEGSTLSPQTARIVPNRRRYTDGIVNSEAGDIPHTDYLLVGAHNLDIAVDDEFTWLGEWYRVTGIHTTRRQESTLAAIDFLGKPNRNG